MKHSFLLLTMIITYVSCNQRTQNTKTINFDNFIFSQSELHSDYSLKFTNSDTIFLQRRFPRPTALFYSIIQKNENLKVDSFLMSIDFKKYDTLYVQNNLEDGSSYKFVLTKDTITNWTFIYGDKGPKLFYDFASWLRNLKEKRSFYPFDKTISFGNLNYILLPEVPPPPLTNSSR